jgi:hypothetical protein
MSRFTISIIIVIVITLIAYFTTQNITESFQFPQYYGRDPNGKLNCCGNMDWYFGKNYNNFCGGYSPKAFAKIENIEGFELNSEMIAKDALVGNDEYHTLDNKCRKINKNWKGAFNPTICTKGENLISEANCMCIDKNYNCAKCYKKINLAKYLG